MFIIERTEELKDICVEGDSFEVENNQVVIYGERNEKIANFRSSDVIAIIDRNSVFNLDPISDIDQFDLDEQFQTT